MLIKRDKKIIKKSKSTKKARPKGKKGGIIAREKRLLEFWGRECPHCKSMNPLIERLKKELRLKVEQLEVWHNEKNARLLAEYDRDLCGGVPFFFNEATGEWICGEVTYERLKDWAEGKKNKT